MARSFKEFLASSTPGMRYAYHIGLLMKDRQTLDPWSGKWGNNPLHYEAADIYKAYEEGKVELVQEKRDGLYIYYAIKRQHAFNRRRHDRPNGYAGEHFRQIPRPRSARYPLDGSGAFGTGPFGAGS